MSDDTQLPDGVDESEREAFEVWVANGNDADDADGFRDAYAGLYSTVGEYAEELSVDCYDIPEALAYYVDYESMERDWEYAGDIWRERTVSGVYVFRNYG